MSTTLSLAQMVDLALGTPEVGAVNFNVLHTLLHAVLGKLNLSAVKADISEADRDLLAQTQTPRDGSDGETDKSIPLTRSNYHRLEDKVSELEKQLKELHALPSNVDLFERTSRGKEEGLRPVADMWQGMKLTRRVDANEEGISKLMSLVEDMMKEMNTMKSNMDNLNKKIDKMGNTDDLLKRLKELEDKTNEMNNRISQLPGKDYFEDFVTWPGLESALKGLKMELTPQERLVIEIGSQTDPSRPSSAKSPRGPSEELQKLLERLGKLTNRHDKLEVRVDDLEDQMKSKLDKDALEGLGGVPSDLLDQLKDLKNQLKDLQRHRDKLAQPPAKSPTPEKQPSLEKQPSSERQPSPVKQPSREDQASQESRATFAPAEDPKKEVVVSKTSVKTSVTGLPSKSKTSIKTSVTGLPSKSVSAKTFTTDSLLGLDVKPDLTEKGDTSAAMEELQDKYNDVQKKVASLEEQMGNLSSQLHTKTSDLQHQVCRIEQDQEETKEKVKSLQMLVMTSQLDVSDDTGLGGISEEELRDIKSCSTDDYSESKTETPKSHDHPTLGSGHMLGVRPSEVNQLQNKMAWLIQDSNRQIAGIKERLYKIEEELLQISSSKHESSQHVTPSTTMDSDALTRMQQIVLNLQAELERLSETASNLLDDSGNKTKQIEELFSTCKRLQDDKADKEFVHMEVEVKADKRLVDSKVNRSVFDSTCDELNKLIQDILGKLSGHEEEWKKALGLLTDDIDGKLDRLEFGPIRDELERQLRALMKKISQMNYMGDMDDDAAGIRKQLLQRFHCISCDRPVDMMPQGPIPSIPAPSGLPATRSSRPYTTFELDQIRQQAKRPSSSRHNLTNFERSILERQVARCRMHSHDCNTLMRVIQLNPRSEKRLPLSVPKKHKNVNTPGMEIMDLYATNRSCGGNHTLTQPHRRMTRMTHINNLFKEEETTVPLSSYREEVDIQGADGHIYRGRGSDGLPVIPGQQASPSKSSTSQRAQTATGGSRKVAPPSSPQTRGARPTSARVVMRPTSSVGSRPHSGTAPITMHPVTPAPSEAYNSETAANSQSGTEVVAN